MAYSVNWGTKVITIPKADTDFVSASPDVRELDVTVLWNTLIDIEETDAAMSFPPIVENTAPKVLTTELTLGRCVLIINGYTLTFEDGLYAVNIIGGNSNLSQVVNKNSVSVNTDNSAGLVIVAGAAAPVDFDDLLDGEEVEPGFTVRQSLRLMLAALAGKVSGGDGPVVRFRDVNDTKDRITSTADADGNRGPVTYDTSG